MSPIGVLLALGAGRRPTQPVFRDRPPQLIPLANRTLLAHAVADLRTGGVDSVALLADPGLANRLGDELRRLAADLPVDVRSLAQVTGGIDAVGELRRLAGGSPVVVHTGTALVGGALTAWPEAMHDADALVLTAPRTGSPAAPIGVAVASDAALAAVARARPHKTLVAALAAADVAVVERVAEDGWALGPDASSVLEGNRIALSTLRASWHPDSLRGGAIEGQVIIDPTATVEDSLIRGPAIVGPGAVVRHAYVGPYTSIGRGTVVENAEIEHSIVLENVRIRHVGWRLERSVIGDRAEISRGFRLPQAVHLHVGDDARISVS